MSLGERVPNLRFPGFEGEWEEKRIGDIYSERSERPSEEMELLSVTITDGVIPRTDIEWKDNSSEDKSNYKIVRIGDMAYNTMRMWQGACGISSYEGIVSPAYTILKDAALFNHDFMASLFKTERMINNFRKNSQGLTSDTWNLKYPQIATIKLRLPTLSEQNKIANLFTLISSRIAAQRKLVELLKKHKRGLIKRLFRPNEHTKWKSVRLGDVGTFHKGAPLSKADISEDGKPFILYGELYTTYGEIIKDVVRRTTAEIDIPYLSRCGDVIIPTSGETAEEIATASCIMSDGVVLGGDLNIYRSEHIDGRFLAYAVRFIISRDISRIAQGVSVVHISATELKRISVSIPSKDEQIRIISVLENYDNRILHSQEILKKMETTKDGLLQQLFV